MKKPTKPKNLTTYNELVVSDLHLTESVDDEYKWDVFPWITEQLKLHGIKKLLILGDTLDKKDRHPSKLVNRLVHRLTKITDTGVSITVLLGNHDYISAGYPFLSFINNIENIEYLIVPTVKENPSGGKDLWLPHTRTPLDDWEEYDFSEYDRIFIHQSIIGAKTSQFYNIEHGLPTNFFKECKGKVFAGDIHIPQEINSVFYIGSPYPVHFGDHFTGCGVLMNGTRTKRLYRETLRKQSVTISSFGELEELEFASGDRLKVTLALSDVEVHSWQEYKKDIEEYCEYRGIELKGITLKKHEVKELENTTEFSPMRKSPMEVFEDFCEHLKIDETTTEVGKEILEQVTR